MTTVVQSVDYHTKAITHAINSCGHNITVRSCYRDFYSDSIIVVIEKDNYCLKQTISRFEIEDGLLHMIIKNMIDHVVSKTVQSVAPWGGGSDIKSTYPHAIITSNGTGSVTVPAGTINTISTGVAIPQSSKIDEKALKIFSQKEIDAINALKKKANEYYHTHMLESMHQLMSNGKFTDSVVIAGGCFTSWYHNEVVKDVDVFILNDDLLWDVIEGNHIYEDPKRFKIGNSSYMTNANVVKTAFDTFTKIQYISTKFNTRQELLNHFDAVHACISFQNHKLYVTREAFDAMRTKTLKENNRNKIAGWRIKKFVGERGFRVA